MSEDPCDIVKSAILAIAKWLSYPLLLEIKKEMADKTNEIKDLIARVQEDIYAKIVAERDQVAATISYIII